MAIIFYHPDGTIYGVHHTHPDDPSFAAQGITLPEGVAWIEVSGLPHAIPWPAPEPEVTGREQWSRVNPVTKVVELRGDRATEIDHEKARQVLAARQQQAPVTPAQMDAVLVILGVKK